MGNFQKNVLMIACFVFILIMILVAILMKNETKTQDFPPQIGDCPDYWQKMEGGFCQNVQGLGSSCKSPMDFSTSEFVGKGGNEARCQFAKNCKIEWDGITNTDLC